MSNATPYYVPPQPGRFSAVFLAVLVHAILLAFLWIGINWANDKPEPIEAEVWSTKELEAAQAPTVQPDTPAPKEIEAPRPKVEQPPPAANVPDIALETEKKRLKEEKQKREELAREKEEEKERAKKQAQEAAKDAAQKEDQEKRQKQQQLAEEKRKQAERDQKIREEFRKQTDSDIVADHAAKPGNGTASKSQGKNTDKKWGDAVTKKIKSNIDFRVPATIDSNPSVSFEVSLLPDGSILNIHQTKSSGLPEFDKAVRQAIEVSAPYPKDSTGVVPTPFTSTHYLKD